MTKTLKISAIALLGALVLWACGGADLGAKETAEKFLVALTTGDYGTAKDYATAEAAESIDMVEKLGGEKGSASDIVVGEVEENGDNATANYTEKGEAKTLDLVKVDGKWKANWSKMGGGSEMGGAMEELESGLEDAVEDLGEALEGAMEEATEE